MITAKIIDEPKDNDDWTDKMPCYVKSKQTDRIMLAACFGSDCRSFAGVCVAGCDAGKIVDCASIDLYEYFDGKLKVGNVK